MKKNNTSSAFLKFLVVQFLLGLAFFFTMKEAKPVSIHELKEETVVVEKKYYKKSFSEYKVGFYSDSINYRIVNYDGVGNSMLFDTIFEGESVSIIYYVNDGFWGQENRVISISSNTIQNGSIEKYFENQKFAMNSIIIIFALIELVFCCVMGIYVILYKKIF